MHCRTFSGPCAPAHGPTLQRYYSEQLVCCSTQTACETPRENRRNAALRIIARCGGIAAALPAAMGGLIDLLSFPAAVGGPPDPLRKWLQANRCRRQLISWSSLCLRPDRRAAGKTLH